MRNKDAFLVLQTTFLNCTTSHLGKVIIDVILNIYKCDPANYFILESQQTLSTFLENLTNKNEDIQVSGRSEEETGDEWTKKARASLSLKMADFFLLSFFLVCQYVLLAWCVLTFARIITLCYV